MKLRKLIGLAGLLVSAALALGSGLARAATAPFDACVGDCDARDGVTVNEIITLVNIILGNASSSTCASGIPDGGKIDVATVITAVDNALNGCVSPTVTPTSTSTASPSETPTPTATATPGSGLTQVAARDAHGVALSLNQTVTAKGIVTVSAGLFANNKLKIFIQDAGAGVMLFDQSAAGVPAFQAGDNLQVTGVVRQEDTTSTDIPMTGTVMIDVSDGSWTILSSGNPLPAPALVNLGDLQAGNGIAFEGQLVRVPNVQKLSGSWPALGSKSTEVTISDDGGTTQLILRIQKNTIRQDLVNELNAVGNGPFTLQGIVIQNDTSGGDPLGGFEIWLRGAEDITPIP